MQLSTFETDGSCRFFELRGSVGLFRRSRFGQFLTVFYVGERKRSVVRALVVDDTDVGNVVSHKKNRSARSLGGLKFVATCPLRASLTW